MTKKYEALFIFSGALKEESLERTVEQTTAEITNLGGTIESTEDLGRKTFVRPMQKRDNGVYVRVRFEIDPGKMAAVRASYKHNEDVFRVQFTARDERYEAAVEADRQRRAEHRAKIEAEEAAKAAAEAEQEAEPATEAEPIA